MLDGCVPYPPKMVERYVARGYWRGLTFTDLLDANAARRPDDLAVVAGERRLTWQEVRRQSDHLARQLLARGLRPRDRVILQFPNVPEFLIIYLALARIGAIPITCLPSHRHSEIVPIARLTDAAVYVVPPTLRGFDYLALAREVREAVSSVRLVLTTGEDHAATDTLSIGRLLREPVGGPEAALDLGALRPDPFDVGVFQLSGGTTGAPKVIPRTYNDYVYNGDLFSVAAGHGPRSVSLIVAPMAHNAPLLAQVMGALVHGFTMVLAPASTPDEVFPLIERERVTHTFAVPAMLVQWLASPLRRRHDLSTLEVVLSGGAKVVPELARQVRPALGCRLANAFGMAEGFVTSTRPDDPDDVVWETVGRPLSPDDEFRIVDEAGRPVGPGEVGELEVRGPYTLRGYYRAADVNREAFTADGFYRTGDMLRVDDRGNLIVEGRKKDLINRGGEKISSEEIENLLLGHPKIENVAVVAMPDPVMGERACAFIVARPGEGLSLDDITAFLHDRRIARFKFPERLEVVERFPLTSVGKVSKKALREEIARKVHAEGAAERPR